MIVTTATVPPNVQFVIDRYMKFHEYIDLGEGVSNMTFSYTLLCLIMYNYMLLLVLMNLVGISMTFLI